MGYYIHKFYFLRKHLLKFPETALGRNGPSIGFYQALAFILNFSNKKKIQQVITKKWNSEFTKEF